MKKKIIYGLILLVVMACAACTVGLAATIEGYSPLDFQIGLPTEAPASGGFYSAGYTFSRSDEPVSTLTWFADPIDGGPALTIHAEGTGKDSKRAVLNLDPNVIYTAGATHRYTIGTRLNDFIVSTEVVIRFVDSLPSGSWSLTAAKVTSASTMADPVPLSDGVMAMDKSQVYVLTGNAPVNSKFTGYTLQNPDFMNDEWEEIYSFDYPDLDVDESTQTMFKAKQIGTYSHSFTASYYGSNLACSMPYTLEIRDAQAVRRTISFEMNEGTVAFNVAWPNMGYGYPETYPMEDVVVTNGTSYTAPECTVVPPDWKMFDYWSVQSVSTGTVISLEPGDPVLVTDDLVFTPIWTDRTFSYPPNMEFGTLVQGVDDPPSFFVHNFLIPYIPADMVPYTDRGNKTPYERNIRIIWYRIENGARVEEPASTTVFATPSETAPGGAYFQAMAPGEVGDYELVITYKGTEVINLFWSMVAGEAPAGSHNYELQGTLDKEYDGTPVIFDPGKNLVVDKGTVSWAELQKSGSVQIIFREFVEKMKDYRDMEDTPVEVGLYRLVIQELGDKKEWIDAVCFDFEIREGSAQPASHTVSFQTGNAQTAPEAQTVADGECAVEPADPVRIGAAFCGWFAEGSGSNAPFDFTTPITEDIILYADWLIPETDRLLILPENLSDLGPESFIGTAANGIVMPLGLRTIPADLLEGSSVEFIFGFIGSAAQSFVQDHPQYRFIPIDADWLAGLEK